MIIAQSIYGKRWTHPPVNKSYTKVDIGSSFPQRQRNKNTKYALKRFPRFHDLPRVSGGRISIVGGSPSVKNMLNEIERPIMVCGSAHRFLREHNIPIDYAVQYDPLPVCANYFTNNDKDCTYLVASTCDKSVFKNLRGFNVRIWHPEGDVDKKLLGVEEFYTVGGGLTVTLRALPLAIILGFTHIDFYGIDCSFETEQYAYDPMKYGDGNDFGEGIDVFVKGKPFRTTTTLASQAAQFLQMIGRFPFTFKVHGDGMLQEQLYGTGKNPQGPYLEIMSASD